MALLLASLPVVRVIDAVYRLPLVGLPIRVIDAVASDIPPGNGNDGVRDTLQGVQLETELKIIAPAVHFCALPTAPQCGHFLCRRITSLFYKFLQISLFEE